MSNNNVCRVCNTVNLPGHKQCQKCGSVLQTSDTDTEDIIDPSTIVTRELKEYKDELKPGIVGLRILGEGVAQLVTIKDELILGRAFFDPAQHLTHANDHHRFSMLGISRRHAVIRTHEEGYTIEDLNSTNGTRVNTRRLLPGQPQTLKSGDQVQLGELILFLSFVPHK